jgi:NAD(P)-dependent dehydrogenase (short-subunit alcohol dehydrogenase family)
MAIDLSGKPILITGASSGIGLAAAHACADAGMPVVLSARRTDRLHDAVRQIVARGGRAEAFPCDVVNPDQCRHAVDFTVERFGWIHSVFANAGYGFESRVLDATDQQLRDLFETNFFGTMNIIRPAAARMLEKREGHILLCSSAASKLGLPMFSAYSASKAMQDHFGRALRIELLRAGVHVSTIHPIGTRTEFSQVVREHSGGRERVAATPEHKRQNVEVVARAIVRTLRRPRGEVWTHLPTRIALALGTAFPALLDHVLARRFAKKHPR